MKDKNIGIYSITNVINGKRYIGQSTNIKKRWQKHINDSKNEKASAYNYPICKALRKYGVDNFDFSILENCSICSLDEREIYWIDSYNSIEDGYNQTIGGQNPVAQKLKKAVLEKVIDDLKNTMLPMTEIAKKYNVSLEMISGINTGRQWKQDRDYPIRKHAIVVAEKVYCKICGSEVTGKKYNYCRKCYFKEMGKNVPQKEVLLADLLVLPMTKIGEKYGESDKAVVKWCKKYDLPYKYHDIKKLRESLK